MHAGLELHDGSEAPAAAEVRRVVREVRSAGGDPPRVAQLFDYEDLWATDLQPHAQGWSYRGIQLAFYSVLRGLGVDVAITHPDRDLSSYALVIAPALHLVADERAARLTRYVRAGGRLLLGPRSGAKTPTNVAHAPAPGPLRPLSGVRIERVDALRPGIEGHVKLAGSEYAFSTWADLLEPEDAETMASYRVPAYAGAAALTRRAEGRGACLTLGALGGPELLAAILTPLLSESGVAVSPMPEGVRMSRVGRGTLVNFNAKEAAVGGVRVPGFGAAFVDEQGGVRDTDA